MLEFQDPAKLVPLWTLLAVVIAAGGALASVDLSGFARLTSSHRQWVKILGIFLIVFGFLAALVAMVLPQSLALSGAFIVSVVTLLVPVLREIIVRVIDIALIPLRLAMRAIQWLLARLFWWVGKGVIQERETQLEAKLRSQFAEDIDELEAEIAAAQRMAAQAQAGGPYGFRPIWIGNVVNDKLERIYDDPPIGGRFLEGVWFEIPAFDLTRGINNTLHTERGREYTVNLSPAVRGVRALYLLVNSTNTYERHRGTEIGQIELVFDEGTCTVPLVTGQNVREWCIGHPGTLSSTTDPDLKEVGRLRRVDPPPIEAVIDMLKVELDPEFPGDTLQRITIVDAGIGDHRLLICGITCLAEI